MNRRPTFCHKLIYPKKAIIVDESEGSTKKQADRYFILQSIEYFRIRFHCLLSSYSALVAQINDTCFLKNETTSNYDRDSNIDICMWKITPPCVKKTSEKSSSQ